MKKGRKGEEGREEEGRRKREKSNGKVYQRNSCFYKFIIEKRSDDLDIFFRSFWLICNPFTVLSSSSAH